MAVPGPARHRVRRLAVHLQHHRCRRDALRTGRPRSGCAVFPDLVRPVAAMAVYRFEQHPESSAALIATKNTKNTKAFFVGFVGFVANDAADYPDAAESRRLRRAYPHHVSPGARCARTTSGFNSIPSPGLSVTWTKPSLIYGPPSSRTWSIQPPSPVIVSSEM